MCIVALPSTAAFHVDCSVAFHVSHASKRLQMRNRPFAIWPISSAGAINLGGEVAGHLATYTQTPQQHTLVSQYCQTDNVGHGQ